MALSQICETDSVKLPEPQDINECPVIFIAPTHDEPLWDTPLEAGIEGYGVRGQSELKLNEATVIATAIAPIVAAHLLHYYCFQYFILIRQQERPASVAVHILSLF